MSDNEGQPQEQDQGQGMILEPVPARGFGVATANTQRGQRVILQLQYPGGITSVGMDENVTKALISELQKGLEEITKRKLITPISQIVVPRPAHPKRG